MTSFEPLHAAGSVRSGVDDRRSRFATWRSQRPFWGGVLLCLAGLVIGWVPAQFAGELMFVGGTFTVIGLVFAAFVFLAGAFALYRPDLSTILGISGVALAILSLLGALGGLFVGMLVGIVGGNLCVAWTPPDRGDARDDAPSDHGAGAEA
ncbi:MAG: DUF6114 domain-containing protein [Haloarculaceae archaeon]